MCEEALLPGTQVRPAAVLTEKPEQGHGSEDASEAPLKAGVQQEALALPLSCCLVLCSALGKQPYCHADDPR